MKNLGMILMLLAMGVFMVGCADSSPPADLPSVDMPADDGAMDAGDDAGEDAGEAAGEAAEEAVDDADAASGDDG